MVLNNLNFSDLIERNYKFTHCNLCKEVIFHLNETDYNVLISIDSMEKKNIKRKQQLKVQ